MKDYTIILQMEINEQVLCIIETVQKRYEISYNYIPTETRMYVKQKIWFFLS